jgi:hypothetical protein
LVQEAAPTKLLKVPAGHEVAEVAPVPLTKVPAGALVQGVDPVALKLPGVHSDGGTTSMLAQYMPKLDNPESDSVARRQAKWMPRSAAVGVQENSPLPVVPGEGSVWTKLAPAGSANASRVTLSPVFGVEALTVNENGWPVWACRDGGVVGLKVGGGQGPCDGQSPGGTGSTTLNSISRGTAVRGTKPLS